MKLKKLFKNIQQAQIKSSRDISITGISTNSKLVVPGNLFIARRGQSFDGATFIPEALSAGACAVLTDLYDPSLKQAVQVIHPNVASIEAQVAAEYYQHPAEELFMVGITGTNGKTTTSFIVRYLLDQFRGPCGLIGTIEYIVGSQRYQATRTTPEAATNHKMLREMCMHGCQSAIMEVTSHALVQGRVDMIAYDVAVFTNLTLDHLDYHQTMDEYCLAKNILFRQLGKEGSRKQFPRWAVVNYDDPWTPKMVEGCQSEILTYGLGEGADLRALEIALERTGTRAKVVYQGVSYDCFWPLAGRFNVYNCLAGMAVGLIKGVPMVDLIEKMKKLPPVRGRLEPVTNELGKRIYVDFAHSDDALKNVLETLNEVKKGRIITVFGCGGDRDRSKRPKMAAICEAYSDISIVTSDNPRSENPQKICEEIVSGFKHTKSYLVEVDRRLAIKQAIELCGPQDIVLIAGKGHETTQIFAHQTIKFDDVEVARTICHQLKHPHS